MVPFNIKKFKKMTLKEWQLQRKNVSELLIQSSSKDGKDSWQEFPIGMHGQFVNFYNKNDIIKNGNHKRTVLCAINPLTDRIRRPEGLNRVAIVSNLQNNNIYNINTNATKYYKIINKYKFVVSPEGNGIDCHRHYEALLFGAIPIVEFNPLIKKKYRNLPILYTNDYTEITEDYLNKKYVEMLDKKYDFSSLFLPFYKNNQRKMIKDCGNHWIKHMLNMTWY